MLKYTVIVVLACTITSTYAIDVGLLRAVPPESYNKKPANVNDFKHDISTSNNNQGQDVINLEQNPFKGEPSGNENHHKQVQETTGKGRASPKNESESKNPTKKEFVSNLLEEGNKNGSNQNEHLTPIHSNKDNVQSGALIRSFYVFLGLSILSMIYFVYRSFRLTRGSQPPSTVRKYGITARRSDMEMRPLELDDDDDDTLFEISTQNTNAR